MRIYVDGSAIGNQNVDADTPAGWGIVVVKEVGTTMSHSTGNVVYENWGPVVTDIEEDNYIGAEVGSNNTGELTAIYEALKFIESRTDESFVIFGDSMYAGKMAMSEWKAKENLDLVSKIRKKWDELKLAGHDMTWIHIKAHAGHLWNERADHLALSAANRERPTLLSEWLK